MKYGTFDTNGFPTGFYNDVFHSSIPAEAIELTEEQWAEFVSNPGQRKWTGSELVEATFKPEPPEIGSYKQQAKNQIDTTAGNVRAIYSTTSIGQSLVYQEKVNEAAQFIADGYPEDLTEFPFIQAEIEATGKTKEQVADDIMYQKSMWVIINTMVEKQRMSGKTQIEQATTHEEIDAILTATITALNNI